MHPQVNQNKLDFNLIVILFLTLIIGFISFFTIDNYYEGGDIFKRLFLTYQQVQTGEYFVHNVWQPMHFWVMSFFYQIFGHVEFAGRFVSIISYIGLQYYFYRYHKLFNKNAVVACFILLTSSYFFVIATQTYSELMYLFFVMGGIYHFELYRRDNAKSLIYFCLFFSAANLTRTEPWILAALLCLYILFDKKPLKPKLLPLTIVTLSVVYFLFKDWEYYGKVFYFLIDSDANAMSESLIQGWGFSALIHPIRGPYNTVITVLGGLVVLYKIFKRKMTIVDSIIVFLMVFVFYKTATGTLINNPRYWMLFYLWAIFMVMDLLCGLWRSEHKNSIGAALLLIYIFGEIFAIKYINYHTTDSGMFRLKFSQEQIRFIDFLKSEIKGKTYAMDREERALEYALFYKLELDISKSMCWNMNEYWHPNKTIKNQVDICTLKEGPDYFILFPPGGNINGGVGGHLNKYFDSSPGNSIFSKYEQIYNDNGFEVLRKKAP